MAKIRDGGSAGPDDPIYTGGVQLFTPGRFRPSPIEQPAEPEPEPPVLPTQLKSGEVEVSVEWYGVMKLVLDAAMWASIKRGRHYQVDSRHDLGEVELHWRWRFNTCGRGLLVLDWDEVDADECHCLISELDVRVGPTP